MNRLLSGAAAAALIAGCAGPGNQNLPSAQAPTSNEALASPHRVELVLRIAIPKRKRVRHGLRAQYLSPSTRGMSIAFSGPTKLVTTIGLTPSSPGCSSIKGATVCTESVGLAPCSSKTACYSGEIVTYDKIACAGSACVVPPGARALSANQDVTFSIAAGKKNRLNLTLYGIPASVALLPLPPSTLTGSSSGGFTISKCVTAVQRVNVTGIDADGNQIVGPGAPASSALSSSDATHLAIAAPSPSSPNTFGLVPPSSLKSATLPNPGAVVRLTARITPLAHSGASTVSSVIDVAFNDDVCGVITEYPISTSASEPIRIAVGPDGALWFTEFAANKIGRITTTGTITNQYTVPTGSSHPDGIAAGHDGALWFAESTGDKIGRIDTGGRITNEYPIPTGGSFPSGIVAGSLGLAVWATEFSGNKIAKITTSGTVTEIPITGTSPTGIAVGPDNAFWFTEAGGKIGRITTGSVVTNEFSLPKGGGPNAITSGPDGALWFTEYGGNRIGRITTGGTITETAIPTFGSNPQGIAAGPDGALWFTECIGNKIGRITTSGTITNEYSLPTGGDPQGIVMGPDLSLWFTECVGNKIARLQ